MRPESRETSPSSVSELPQQTSLGVGTVLVDRFEVMARLGQGSTGVVYQVRDRESDTALALKTLRVPRPQHAHLIKSEFRAARAVSHPNVVRVHELFVTDELAFMTMQLVSGVSVTDYVWSQHESERSALLRSLMNQCVSGVQALHARGLLHRDLKPANVLVGADGGLTIVDLGLASGATLGAGTPAYMAPEQAIGEPPSSASDWYSVGAILYECLSRQLPGSGALGNSGELESLCHRLLDPDPDRRPLGGELSAVFGPDDGTALQPAAARVFVAREGELDALATALDRGRREATIVLIRGSAGSGKTSLAREFAEHHLGDAVILRAACNQYENVPFNAFDGIVDELMSHVRADSGELAALLDRVAELFPTLQGTPGWSQRRAERLRTGEEARGHLPRERRRSAFRALRQLLAGLDSVGPVVLWIDDIQWADADSLDLLTELLAAPTPHDLLLLCCARSEPATSGFVEALERATNAGWHHQVIELAPLDPTESYSLAAALSGPATAPHTLSAIAAESNGNPLFVEELVRLAVHDPNGVSLTRAIRGRLERLTANELRFLETLSVCSAPLAEPVAHMVAAAEGGRTVIQRLDTLHLTRWTARRGELAIHHALIAEEVRAGLDQHAAQRCHSAMVDALSRWGAASAALMAEHLFHSGRTAEALPFIREAASDAVASLAFHHAARWLRLGLRTPETLSSETLQRDLHVELASALRGAGRGSEAAEHYALAASLSIGSTAQAHQCSAAEQLLSSGNTEQGFAMLDSILHDVGVRRPRSSLGAVARLLRGRGQLILRTPRSSPTHATEEQQRRVDALAAAASGYMLTDPLRGAGFASHQLIGALRLGDPRRLVRALLNEVLYLANEGAKHQQRVDELVARAGALAAEVNEPETHALYQLARGGGATLTGRFREAAPALLEAERCLTQPGLDRWWELMLCRLFRSITLWFTGTLTTLDAELEVWLADAIERGDGASERCFAGERPLVLLALDRADDARAEIEGLRRELGERGFDEHRLVWLHNQIQYDLYTGASAEQLIDLVRQMRPFWRSLMSRSQLMRATSHQYVAQAYIAAATMDPSRRGLLRKAARSARALQKESVAYARDAGLLLAASIAHIRGQDAECVAGLRQAARGFSAGGQLLMLHGANWRLGLRMRDATGAALASSARGSMVQLGVAKPERMLSLLVPGFED